MDKRPYIFYKDMPLHRHEELKDRLHRAYSTRRVLPNVQISEAALNRARSLHVPAKKRVPMEGIRSSSRATNSPSPSEIAQRTHRPPSVGGRPHRNLQKYRQASIVASSVTSSAISNSPLAPRLSPNLSHRGETRHQARSMKGNDKPEQRMRRQLPCKVVLPNNSNEEMDEGESVASTFDDFDYFCSISYSPSSKVAPNYTAETTQTRRQRMRGRRSHSMLHPNESVVDYSSPSTSFTTASSGKDHVVDKRVFSRTLTTYNQDIVEDITPKRMSGNASRNNSSVSLTQGSRASYSPGRPPITPQAPPKIPSGSRESPLGAAISQEALEADDPDLVEFKVQVVGSPSVGKSTICQRLASLNSEDSDDFNEDACEDLQTLSVKATLNGKVFNVGFVETAMYAAEDAMECVDAFVVVYAIDDDSTFEFARRVLLVLRESVRENSLPPAGFILVGNKSDLVRGREVPTDEGNQFAASQKAEFIEVSAVLDHKILELLFTIITHLRGLEEAKAQRPKRPPTNELWGTSRKIAVKMAASGGSGSSGDGGGGGGGGAGSGSGLGGGGGGGGDTFSRISKKPAKNEIVKFFKRHFSKSAMEDPMCGREMGDGT
ncbi:GTP-binding protein REM [Echinococcus granulosus]|uniref:GTP-binding protein REM n=1 Tax=Echinococcus granulosus TaxID=6210 RepID=W6UI66_ECHGR|nr:GTP-binding protein REM [Echinococcus granulosus]EUB60753.1 GTP-binding protein REM [Echinococcus granulosus]